jgi:hypothetical protein
MGTRLDRLNITLVLILSIEDIPHPSPSGKQALPVNKLSLKISHLRLIKPVLP